MVERDHGGDAIVMIYRREGTLVTGQVSVPGEPCPYLTFEKEEFVRALNHLARAIAACTSSLVHIVRTDKPSLLPFTLDKETVELFRVDPVRAIQSFLFQLPTPKKGDVYVTPARLLSGYEALAEAFGGRCFLKVSRGRIGCFGCSNIRMYRDDGEFKCLSCPEHIPAVRLELHGDWVSLSTKELLLLPLKKFYLPLPWNGAEDGWISHQDLATKYEAYLAEKESVCSSSPHSDLLAS